MNDSALEARLLSALEALGAPAFVVGAEGTVLHANAAAKRAIEKAGSSLLARLLSAAKRGYDGDVTVTPIVQRGGPGEILAVLRPSLLDPTERAFALAATYGLSPRKTQVLALLASGLGNKAIAAHLDCAEVTIELHLTAIFARLGCGSRAETLARFWTGIAGVDAAPAPDPRSDLRGRQSYGDPGRSSGIAKRATGARGPAG